MALAVAVSRGDQVAHEAAELGQVDGGRRPSTHEILGASEAAGARGERGRQSRGGGGGRRVSTLQADGLSLVLNGCNTRKQTQLRNRHLKINALSGKKQKSHQEYFFKG